jgi:hypothetical protein
MRSKFQKLGDRNSYTKTEPAATFKRTKEDHMKNGQLKPGYNVQIATDKQFVTHAGIYQRAGDTATLPSFLEDFERSYRKQSKVVVADAGYGSEQNYEFMESKGIEAYVKYNYFHKEQKRVWKKNAFSVQNLFYNPDKDFFICPMGQKLSNIGKKKSKSELGYTPALTRYQVQNCTGYPLRDLCHKSKTNRIIEVNYKLQEYNRKTRERLQSKQGVYHRGRQYIEPEAVFGQMKYNMAYRRFQHVGKDKVTMDFAFFAMAFNIKKLCTKLKKKGL